MTRTNLPRCVPGLCACAWVPAIFLLSAAAPAHGQRSDYKPLPGKVVIVSKPGGPSAAELAVRLTEQQLLGGGALRKIGERAFLVDLAQVPVEQLSASPDVLAVYRAFELDNRVVAANRLLVKFLAPPSDAELQDFASDYNLIAAGRVTRMEEYVTFDVRDSTVDLAQRVRDIQGDARVARVKLDRLMHELTPMQLAPIQDPLAGMQWHLDKIKAQEAWETTLGDGVQVGMLDDAVLFDHPDLQANYTSHSSGPFGAADARPPAEFFSHGTSVMGLICAEANTIGVRGLAPLAQFSATAGIGWAPSSELMKAYGFALDQAVEVHNNSWGLIIPGLVEEDLKEAILNAAEEGRDGLGMVIVFAAGNSGLELQEDDDYNTFEEVISVGAVGETDIKTSYSNFGPTMDVMGPSGGDGLRGIVTTTIEGTLDDIYTPSFGGTSAASPIVAGVAALVVSVNPNLDREQVKNVLLRSAEQVSDADAQYDQTTGFSPNYAYGRVDAAAAVLAAQDSRDSNETWPGVPRDFEVQLVEGGGDEGLLADISWLPAGIPEDDGIRSDQTRVLILQRTGEAEEDIDWRPLDGIVFAYGDINQPDDGDEPAPQQGWVVLYHDFVIEEEEGRQRAPTLVVDGDDADAAQQFAIFAASTSDLFSFGVVINQAGEVVDRTPDDGGGGVVPPPDRPRPINPELDPGVIGEDQPPSVSASVDVQLGAAPLEVEFLGNAATPLTVMNRGWSFGDGNSTPQDTTSHVYRLPGAYNAVFFAENELGVATKMFRIEVQPAVGGGSSPTPVTATIRVLDTPPFFAPATVSMTADTTGVADTSNVASVSYSWEFGDGNVGNGKTTENVFMEPGFYSVLLVVTVTRTSGITQEAMSQTLIEVRGLNPSGSGDPPPVAPPDDDGGNPAAGGGSCGAMAPAMLALVCAALCGWRRRRTWLV